MPNDASWASGPVKCVKPASFPKFSRYGFFEAALRGHRWLGLLTVTFAQAHSGTAPILVDEFHTGSFQGAADCEVVRCSHRRLVVGQFGAADRGNSNRRFAREILPLSTSCTRLLLPM
jgi:hypothetical protein